MLWGAVALLAAPQLQGWQYFTLVSPLFVYLLLARVSGVVLLEHKSDRCWGDDPDYLEYKARTPVLVPKLRP
jgi:steroid 5-alpha reductase family enzyme